MQRLKLKVGYGLPIFAIGAVHLNVLNEDDTPAFTVLQPVAACKTHDDELAIIEAGRAKLQDYIDLINEALAAREGKGFILTLGNVMGQRIQDVRVEGKPPLPENVIGAIAAAMSAPVRAIGLGDDGRFYAGPLEGTYTITLLDAVEANVEIDNAR